MPIQDRDWRIRSRVLAFQEYHDRDRIPCRKDNSYKIQADARYFVEMRHSKTTTRINLSKQYFSNSLYLLVRLHTIVLLQTSQLSFTQGMAKAYLLQVPLWWAYQ